MYDGPTDPQQQQQQQSSTQSVANGAIYIVGGEPQQQQSVVGSSTSIYAVPMEEPLHDPTYSGYTAPNRNGGADATAAALVYAQPVDGAAGTDGTNTITTTVTTLVLDNDNYVLETTANSTNM